MPNYKKSHHTECLNSVCLLCMRKVKSPFKLNDEFYVLIQEYVADGFERNDPQLPNVLCSTCYRVLTFYTYNNSV